MDRRLTVDRNAEGIGSTPLERLRQPACKSASPSQLTTFSTEPKLAVCRPDSSILARVFRARLAIAPMSWRRRGAVIRQMHPEIHRLSRPVIRRLPSLLATLSLLFAASPVPAQVNARTAVATAAAAAARARRAHASARRATTPSLQAARRRACSAADSRWAAPRAIPSAARTRAPCTR